MIAYPWSSEKSHKVVTKNIHYARDVLLVVTLIASIVFSPLALLILPFHFVYRQRNDSRSLIPLVGLVTSAVLICIRLMVGGSLFAPMGHLFDGHTDTGSILSYLIGGLGFSLPFASLALWSWNAEYFWQSRAYLKESAPSFLLKRKLDKNVHELQNAHFAGDDKLPVGVVTKDVPWRSNRYGMSVGVPLEKARFGLVSGATGTGKTIASMNIVAGYAENGLSSVIPDFKANSLITEYIAHAIADANGMSFYPVWSANRDTGWGYDPLANIPLKSVPSIISAAFSYEDEGGVGFYTTAVETFLSVQCAILDDGLLARRSDESVMDFLYRTGTVESLKKELSSVKTNKNASRIEFHTAKLDAVDTAKLSRLRNDFRKVLESFGDKMRPQANMVTLELLDEKPGIAYFGLSLALDKKIAKTIGSLLLQDIVNYMARRKTNQPMLIMPDEMNNIEEKADPARLLFTQGREAGLFCVPSVQNLENMTDEFKTDLFSAAPYIIALQQELATAKTLSDYFGQMNALNENRASSHVTDSFGGVSSESGVGGSNRVEKMPRVSAEELTRQHPHQAYVFFAASPNRATLSRAPRPLVRRDETDKDIPLTRVVSRNYILETANETASRKEIIDGSVLQWEDNTASEVVLPPAKYHFEDELDDTRELPVVKTDEASNVHDVVIDNHVHSGATVVSEPDFADWDDFSEEDGGSHSEKSVSSKDNDDDMWV